jgi:hypothetical protein
MDWDDLKESVVTFALEPVVTLARNTQVKAGLLEMLAQGPGCLGVVGARNSAAKGQ